MTASDDASKGQSAARESDDKPVEARPEGAAPDKDLPPAAQRALREAAERRAKAAEAEKRAEKGGPAGPEPTRYGDWERKGRAVDFS
ncbi:MAG: DUF1674 domain-containing protein [Pseudomonadota bacterium]